MLVTQIPTRIVKLRKEMRDLASKLEFEKAAVLRDEIQDLEARLLAEGRLVG